MVMVEFRLKKFGLDLQITKQKYINNINNSLHLMQRYINNSLQLHGNMLGYLSADTICSGKHWEDKEAQEQLFSFK